MIFSDDNAKRKSIPVFDGAVMYFPNALAAVAEVSREGNKQHNPGEPLHWARDKSTDQFNTALRHLIDHANGCRFDVDGQRHLAKAAWRVLAALQLDIEAEKSETVLAHHGLVDQAKLSPCDCPAPKPIPPQILRPLHDHAPDCTVRHGYETSCTEAALPQAAAHQTGGFTFQPSDNCDCDVCRNWQADWPIRALNEYLAAEFGLGV